MIFQSSCRVITSPKRDINLCTMKCKIFDRMDVYMPIFWFNFIIMIIYPVCRLCPGRPMLPGQCVEKFQNENSPGTQFFNRWSPWLHFLDSIIGPLVFMFFKWWVFRSCSGWNAHCGFASDLACTPWKHLIFPTLVLLKMEDILSLAYSNEHVWIKDFEINTMRCPIFKCNFRVYL